VDRREKIKLCLASGGLLASPWLMAGGWPGWQWVLCHLVTIALCTYWQWSTRRCLDGWEAANKDCADLLRWARGAASAVKRLCQVYTGNPADPVQEAIRLAVEDIQAPMRTPEAASQAQLDTQADGL
jgi:hypothetical protein